jgi:hypothetical protein
MVYDVKNHFGQQVENFLNGFAAGDIGIMVRSLDNFKSLAESSDMKTVLSTLEKWDNEKNVGAIKNIHKKAMDAVKVISSSDNIDNIFIDIEEIKEDAENAFKELNGFYWEKVRSLMLKTVNDYDFENEPEEQS